MRLLILLVLLLQGCSVLEYESLSESGNEVMVVQDLLNQGWNLHAIEGKIVLIKATPEGLLIEDVFGVMEE